MIKIIRKNSTGKTRELLQAASREPHSIVVCKNPERMQSKALAYEIIGLQFISYEDFWMLEDHEKKVFIDDLDSFLESSPVKVQGYNLTIE